MKSVLLSLILILSIFSAQFSFADKAYFAGGCFWCMEADFEKLDGVVDVISGFTGGTLENPTYNGDHGGHYEAVEIIYDSEVISYHQLLVNYWVNIDPFDDYGQFCDKGSSYKTAIFVSNDQERELAEKSNQQVVENFPDKKVVTPILDASTFWPIKGDEEGHQDFYKKNPVRYKTYRYLCGRDKRLQEIWGS